MAFESCFEILTPHFNILKIHILSLSPALLLTYHLFLLSSQKIFLTIPLLLLWHSRWILIFLFPLIIYKQDQLHSSQSAALVHPSMATQLFQLPQWTHLPITAAPPLTGNACSHVTLSQGPSLCSKFQWCIILDSSKKEREKNSNEFSYKAYMHVKLIIFLDKHEQTWI